MSDGGHTSTSDSSEPDKKRIFEVALETRNLEIRLFWQRSLFFWGFIAAAFVAYSEAMKQWDSDKIIAVSVACFGLISSLSWTLVNRGSRYWQVTWEGRVSSSENEVLHERIFRSTPRPNCSEDRFWGLWPIKKRFSVSRLTIAFSDFTFITWVVLLIHSIPQLPVFNKTNFGCKTRDVLDLWVPYLLLAATFIYGTLMIAKSRSKNEG